MLKRVLPPTIIRSQYKKYGINDSGEKMNAIILFNQVDGQNKNLHYFFEKQIHIVNFIIHVYHEYSKLSSIEIMDNKLSPSSFY